MTVALKPRYFRTGKSAGTSPKIDREGGYSGQGVIRGVSVITRGEALGHEIWADAAFLQQVADAINASPRGVKARFTHPDMSSDGLGRFVGRIMDAEVLGDQVIADQHFSKAGHKTPDGDLAGYLLDLAEEDPEAYGLSIVFSEDLDAADEFYEAHRAPSGAFASPDPRNTDNLPHCRLGELRACDAVDEPAANPAGLFHRQNDTLDKAEALATYALGLASESPGLSFGMDPDRVRGFVSRFMKTKNLTLVQGAEMANEENSVVVEEPQELFEIDTTEIESEDVEAADEPAEDVETETVDEAVETVAASSKTGQDYLNRFGEQGAVWFVEGKTWDQATDAYIEAIETEKARLSKRVDQLERQLDAIEDGEIQPLGFQAENKSNRGKGIAGKIRIAGRQYDDDE